jgi:hypothetical protein
MLVPASIRGLCMPSKIYLLISIVGILMILLQNLGSNENQYDLGCFSCDVPSKAIVFIIKILYVLFWTWILNLMCKDGHSGVSWLLVLLPFILMFVLIGLVMIQ